MKEYYKILGISENATDEEIEVAYKSLREQYSKDRFLEGEKGNTAAKNLTKLDMAYNEIITFRREHDTSDFDTADFSAISEKIKEGKLDVAQRMLDDFSERNAEWHYLQSVIFYKKNWTNESKKQLEIAMSMDKDNPKYMEAYQKLNAKMDYANKQFHSGNANYSTNSNPNANRQMGGDDCGSMADCCTTWCCMNLLCNSCCR